MERKPKFYYVYVITNKLNGKQYVGSKICYTDDPLDDGYFGSSNFLKKDIKEFGKENFEKRIIKQNYKNYQDLLEGETKYILEYNTMAPNGYNRFLPTERESFNTTGITVREIWETKYGREKADKRHKEFLEKCSRAQSGKNNGMFRKHHSKESIKRNIENQPYLGKPIPEWLRKRISAGTKGAKNPFYGKQHSDETKRQISKKQKERLKNGDYSEAYKKSAQTTKERGSLKGDKNGMFGKMWIYNEKLGENKIIRKEELLEYKKEGWEKGMCRKKWMTNIKLKKNKLIKINEVEEYIQNEWTYGRKKY